MPRDRALETMVVASLSGAVTPGEVFDEPGFGVTLAELSQALVCVLDREGHVVAFNRACEEATGYSAAEVVGQDIRDLLVPPEHVEEFGVVLERAFERGESSPVHGWWLTKDGGRRAIDFSNRALRDESGAIGYFVATGLDVTERERATEQVVRLASEQSALRRVATLVARGPAPEEVFAAVTEEAARLLGTTQATTLRFDGDTAVVVGRWCTESSPRGFPVGRTFSLSEGQQLTGTVARTGRPARVDDYRLLHGAVAEEMADLGYRSAVAAPIIVESHTWGTLFVSSTDPEPLGADAEERLSEFTELVALALQSAQAYAELTASRARIVAAGDAERRRLERNLHDGAQQRLVGLALQLRIAQGSVRDDPTLAEDTIGAVVSELQLAIEELREIARGLHPAVLSERGLGPALESLAVRAPFEVEITARVPRLPEPIEAALYYVVAESLTNAAKHASPTVVRVDVGSDSERAWAAIVDDGSGGVELGPGGGLQGLADRIATLGGRFTVTGPPHRGTRVTAELPLRPQRPS